MSTNRNVSLLKWVSPTGCLLALIGFSLVFTDLNCNGKKLDSITGYELVRGYQPDFDIAKEETQELTTETERYNPNLFAVNALIAAILSIVLFIIRGLRKQYLIHTIMSGIGFVSMFGLMINLQQGLKSATSGKNSIVNFNLNLQFDMQIGFWLVTLLFGIATTANGLLYYYDRKKTTNVEPPDISSE